MDTKTILLVDDEEAVLSVLSNSLSALGQEYRVLTAMEGKEALAYLEKYRIDLVITDYRMSGMNGLELLETIRNLQPSTRVIFITAFGSDEVEEEVNRLQAFAYLKKPIELGTFRSAVKKAFGDLDISRPGVVIQTDGANTFISRVLQSLKMTVNAGSIILVDTVDGIYMTVGEIERSRKEKLASLVNTALAFLEKAGDLLDDAPNHSSWLYHQGVQQDLFASRIDGRRMLIVLLRHETQFSKINKTTEINLKTSEYLAQKFQETTPDAKKTIIDQDFNFAVQNELDKLFTDDMETMFTGNNASSAGQRSLTGSSQFSMSYEEALAAGLKLPANQTGSSDNHV